MEDSSHKGEDCDGRGESGVKEGEDCAKEAVKLTRSLNYLERFYSARDKWKFSKVEQGNLLRYIFSVQRVPCTYEWALKLYIIGLRGHGVRNRLRIQARNILREHKAYRSVRKVTREDWTEHGLYERSKELQAWIGEEKEQSNVKELSERILTEKRALSIFIALSESDDAEERNYVSSGMFEHDAASSENQGGDENELNDEGDARLVCRRIRVKTVNCSNAKAKGPAKEKSARLINSGEVNVNGGLDKENLAWNDKRTMKQQQPPVRQRLTTSHAAWEENGRPNKITGAIPGGRIDAINKLGEIIHFSDDNDAVKVTRDTEHEANQVVENTNREKTGSGGSKRRRKRVRKVRTGLQLRSPEPEIG